MEGNSDSQNTTSEVTEKLKKFVTYFVEKFEAKLLLNYQILEGEVKKVGTGTKLAGQVVGGAVGASLGLLFNFLTAGAGLGKEIGEKIATKLGNDSETNEALKLLTMIELFKEEEEKNKCRLALIEAACDVFQSFEMQFVTATADQPYSITIRKLAKVATNRAINYLKQQKDTSISESVILGESKKVSLTCCNPGFNLPKKWNMTSLYDKVGIVIETTDSSSYYKKNDGTSRTDKYGYRRLLGTESWDKLKETYDGENAIEQFSNYHYVITPENVEEHSKNILANLNNKDLNQNRMNEILNKFKKVIEQLSEVNKKLDKLLSSETQTEGVMSGLGIFKYYFISRKLNRHTEIKKEIQQTNNFFIIDKSKVNQSTFQENQDVILISDTRTDFEESCEKYKDSNIHWLKDKKSKFIWQQSQGSLSELRKFVNEGVVQRFECNKITDINDKIVIVSAGPGMGKSTLLTHLAIKQKAASSSCKIIKINLNDHTTKISATDFENKNNIPKFLKEISNIEDPKQLEDSILLIDGFDEIASNSHYKRKVLKLVSFYKDEVARLWITTRPYAQNDLENELSIFSYTIEPLSEDAQKKFLEKFWKTNFVYNVIKELTFKISSEIENEEIKNLAGQVSKIIDLKIVEFQDDDADDGHLKQIHNLTIDFNISKKRELVEQIINAIDQQLGKQHKVSEKIKDLLTRVKNPDTNLEDIKCLIQKRAESYAAKLIAKFSQSVSDREREFTGVPLQVRMLAEAFQKEVHEDFIKSYNLQLKQCDLIEPKLPESLNLFDLYKRFIENKYRINFVEKGNMDLTNAFHLKQYNESREPFMKVHQLLGLALLFSKEDLKKFISKEEQDKIDELINSIGNGTENTGIVYQIINGKPQFIHRTFAEYFTADFFVAKRMEMGEFLREYIFKAENKVIRHFFDRILTDDKAIHRAVLNNDKEQIKKLLSDSQDTENIIDSVDKAGRTALYLAATDGYLEIVEILLQHGATIGIEDTIFGPRTPLDVALCRCQLKVAQCLGEQFNLKRNEINNLQLIIAATNGNYEFISLLVKNERVNINFEILGWTPLHQAIIYKNWEIIKTLMGKGARSDRKPNLNVHGTQLLEELVGKNAKIDYVNQDGYTPLHCAAKDDYLDVPRILIKRFGEVNLDVTDKKRTTPLHVAAFHGSSGFVQYLFDQNAKMNATDNCGATVVFSAACNNNFKIVNFLLEKTTRIDSDKGVIGKLGLTVLHFAALYGELETVERLVEQENVNVNAGSNSFTPLHFAALSNSTDTIKYLKDNNADVNAFVNFNNCVKVFEEEQEVFKNTSMYAFIQKLINTWKNLSNFVGLTPFDLYNIFKYKNEESLKLLKPNSPHKNANDIEVDPSKLRNCFQELLCNLIECTNEKRKTHKCNSFLQNLHKRISAKDEVLEECLPSASY